MRPIARFVVAAALACSLSVLPATASTPWTGMGAKIADWTKAHPKHSAGCPAGGCYGGEAKVGGDPAIQFVTLTTTGAPDYRVDGYTQAIGDGTSLAAAKAAVLKLLPSDTKATAFSIDHDDGNGSSCAFWNLTSKTLGAWFSGKKVGDPKGQVGIELNTVGSNGWVYKANDVAEAVVGIAPIANGTSC